MALHNSTFHHNSPWVRFCIRPAIFLPWFFINTIPEMSQIINKFLFVWYFQSPCESDPCKNGADCVPEYELNSYRCHCKLGFCGTHCEQKGTSLEKNKQTIKDREAICFLRPFLGGCVLGGGRGWRTDAKWLSSMAGMILRWKIGNLRA